MVEYGSTPRPDSIREMFCFLSLSLREIMQETPHLTTFYLNLICKRFLVYYSSYRLKVSLKLKN